MPEIFAEATIPESSPSDVVIVPLPDASSPVPQPPATTIALARLSAPELTVWIRDAVNLLLAELPLPDERPGGQVLERGAFRRHEDQVWAHDWYGGAAGLLLARCDDVESARRLAAVLDALVAGT